MIFGAMVAATAVILGSMDFGKYKGLIVEQTEQATKRKLTIAGDLRLSIFPVPTLTVKDVSICQCRLGIVTGEGQTRRALGADRHTATHLRR